jgi:hypothetical protein
VQWLCIVKQSMAESSSQGVHSSSISWALSCFREDHSISTPVAGNLEQPTSSLKSEFTSATGEFDGVERL